MVVWVVFYEWKVIPSSCVLECTQGKTSSTSQPKINTFQVEDQSFEDSIEENPNQNQDHPIN